MSNNCERVNVFSACCRTVHVGNCRDQLAECSKVKILKPPPKPQPVPKRSSASQNPHTRRVYLLFIYLSTWYLVPAY